jgi:iron(III) transport system permease protein
MTISTLPRAFPRRFPTARRRRLPPAPLLLAGLAVAALCLLAPFYLVGRVAQEPEAARDAILARATFELTVRTLGLVASVTLLAAAIALPIAWLVERTDLPFRRAIGIVASLPLAVPSYVGATVALSAFGPRGLLQQALEPLGVDRLPSIYGFTGATVVLALVTYPYILLTLRPVLAGLDPRLEELSQSFGYGRWTTFWRVIWPQLRPPLLSGGLLVGLYALADFGAVSLLGYRSLTFAVFSRLGSFDRFGASALALVLIVIALVVVFAEQSARGARREHDLRSSDRRPQVAPLGRWLWPALAFLALVLGLSLAVPLGVLTYWLVRGIEAGEAFRGVGGAVWGSLIGSALAALVAVLAALPVALLAVRYRGTLLSRAIEGASFAGYALPGVVVALALATAALNIDVFGGRLYQSLTVLIVGYTVLFLPQAVGAMRVSLQRVHPAMEDAARSLGRRPWHAFASVTLPLASRGVLAGAALVFLTTMKELPATLLLAPIGFDTLAVRVWSASSEAFFARAALPALLLIALSALPLALIEIAERRR